MTEDISETAQSPEAISSILMETTISKNTKYEGRIINVRSDEVRMPSGDTAYREVVEHPGAVAIIAENSEKKLVLVQQYRYPVGEVLLEIPAGKLDPGETPESCARREMFEETGYEAGKIALLTKYYTTAGFSNEIIYLYKAEDLTYQAAPSGDPHEEENIIPVHITREEALQKVKSGEIKDSKTIIAILYLTM